MSSIGTQFMEPVLQNQEYTQRQATLPAELAQKAASTRYTSALADRVETETAGDKRVAAQMAQVAGMPPQAGGAGSMSSQLQSMAALYTQAGMPAKAAELLGKASQAAAHEATAREAAVREAAGKVKMQGEQFKQASQLLSGVTDEASWKKANELFEQQTGQESPFKTIPYDPKVVQLLRGASMNAYQREQLKLRKTAVQATLTNVASEINSRATRDAIALERMRASQQRNQRLAKSGGKDIGAPGKAEVGAADKLLGDTGLAGDERDAAAFSIASEARVLRRNNSGMSADEALRQAKLNAVQSGSIVPGAPSKVPFGLGKPGAAKFSPPQPIPKNSTIESLVKGQVHSDGKGNVGEWDGNGWVNNRKVEGAGKAPGKTSAPPSGDADPLEDDDVK